jgi:hypothetical protein
VRNYEPVNWLIAPYCFCLWDAMFRAPLCLLASCRSPRS